MPSTGDASCSSTHFLAAQTVAEFHLQSPTLHVYVTLPAGYQGMPLSWKSRADQKESLQARRLCFMAASKQRIRHHLAGQAASPVAQALNIAHSFSNWA